tara:strand:+ start:396 stop:818 length:423 start_codon:yes stop_codon:yes gene_type:complete
MSGDTVTGFGLQFTNDNKHAYAYSGRYNATSAGVDVLEFQTNSEYIDAKFNFSGWMDLDDPTTGLRGIMNIFFNDKEVQAVLVDNDNGNMVGPLAVPLIIPPFTTVRIKLYANSTSASYQGLVSVIGKVGMPQRVGNYDE